MHTRLRNPHPIARRMRAVPLTLLCLLLAACGSVPATQGSPIGTSTPTPNPKGEGTTIGVPADATPVPPPYAFPATWRKAPGLPRLSTVFPAVYAFAPSDRNTGYVCAGTANSLYETHDGGATWQMQTISAFTDCSGVFVDAHNARDVFVENWPPDTGTSGAALWRSQDGGASWHKLGAVTGTGFRLAWDQIAVVGSRLIGNVEVDQEGSLNDTVYYSDNGGATWHPFAQSIAKQGYMVSGFAILDSTILLDTTQPNGAAGLSLRSAKRAQRPHHTSTHHSSGTGGTIWWRSTDGGATWSQELLPTAARAQWTTFTVTPGIGNHGAYAMLSASKDLDTSGTTQIDDTSIWWSADDGATWKLLPDLRGAESGFVTGGLVAALAPDGSVFEQAQHTPGAAPGDAGIFRLSPSDASPTWQPIVAGGTQTFQANETAAGLHLWSIGDNQSDTYLQEADVR